MHIFVTSCAFSATGTTALLRFALVPITIIPRQDGSSITPLCCLWSWQEIKWIWIKVVPVPQPFPAYNTCTQHTRCSAKLLSKFHFSLKCQSLRAWTKVPPASVPPIKSGAGVGPECCQELNKVIKILFFSPLVAQCSLVFLCKNCVPLPSLEHRYF